MSSAGDFVIKNGVLKKYTGPGGDVVIPDGVTSIDWYAFSNAEGLMTGLTSVTIPEGVVSIGSEAFGGCYNLSSVTIPESVTSIGFIAFKGCRSLTSITIPENVTDMGQAVFLNCACTVKAKNWSPALACAVKPIKGFYNTEKLSIYTEGMLSEIPALYRRQALLGYVLEKETDFTSERAAAYLDYAQKNAGKLCGYAFDHHELLYFLCEHKLIKAKDIDTYTEEAEKRGNTEYKALLLNYQNELGQETVNKARAKRDKAQTEQIDDVAARAAERDPANGIEGMTFVLTGGLRQYGAWSLEGLEGLKELLKSYGARLGSSLSKKTDYLISNDPEGGSEKSRKAKEYGVPVISEDEFNAMVGVRFGEADQITVPGWLREIRISSFLNCRSLKSVTLPESVERIHQIAFKDCKDLTEIRVEESNPCFSSLDGVLFNKDKTVLIKLPCGREGTYAVPEGVTGIDDYAFMDCRRLTSVTIPEGVTSIGNDAFGWCLELASVTIPESMTTIGDGVFYDCGKLENLTIPIGVTSIGTDAFKKCDSLTIHAPTKSFAEKYAKENGIPFAAE